jgi:hypothetical protein
MFLSSFENGTWMDRVVQVDGMRIAVERIA